jgi:hypothetical protein
MTESAALSTEQTNSQLLYESLSNALQRPGAFNGSAHFVRGQLSDGRHFSAHDHLSVDSEGYNRAENRSSKRRLLELGGACINLTFLPNEEAYLVTSPAHIAPGTVTHQVLSAANQDMSAQEPITYARRDRAVLTNPFNIVSLARLYDHLQSELPRDKQ